MTDVSPITTQPAKRPHRRKVAGDAPPPVDRIVLERERCAMTGVSRAWWAVLEQREQAPKRIKLSERKVGWLLSELQTWIRQGAAGRDSPAPVPGPKPPRSPGRPRKHQPDSTTAAGGQ